MLAAGSAAKVLLIASDSYLNAADINAALQGERVLCATSSAGFIPGEGAAALVLCAADPAAPGLHISGIGTALEQARHDGIIPNRSMGLTQAIRAAAAQAGVAPADLALRLSDQNGDPFYADEATNAMTRLMFGAGKLAHHTLADKAGELGVAAGPAMLAWLSCAQGTLLQTPGKALLVHMADDDGARCALILNSNWA
jgi:3-oxoacyl-[acyl-carrier-protein] synthase-1